MLEQQCLFFNNNKKKKVSEEPDSSVTARQHHSAFHNSCPNQETTTHTPETLKRMLFRFSLGLHFPNKTRRVIH